jgi:beta-lactam-binding protein with PASTA domain
MFKYVTSRPLWFNILIAIGGVFLLLVIFILLLGVITRHGKSKTVPYVVGKNINDVEKQLTDAGFATVIQDSVYYDSLPPGVVIKQIPEADAVVKVNRNVFVIINRFVAPDIPMPNIIGYSLRNAQYTLESTGLKLGDTTSRVDFAKNTVLQMSINGNEIKPGDKVKVGSKVDLVIARGKGDEDIRVPQLVGLQVADARVLLEQYGLNLGAIVKNGNVTDIDNAFVYRQEPMPGAGRIRSGQLIDVWVQVERPMPDSVQQNQPPQLPEQ